MSVMDVKDNKDRVWTLTYYIQKRRGNYWVDWCRAEVNTRRNDVIPVSINVAEKYINLDELESKLIFEQKMEY